VDVPGEKRGADVRQKRKGPVIYVESRAGLKVDRQAEKTRVDGSQKKGEKKRA